MRTLLVGIVVLSAGCATGIALTSQGARVQHVERAAVPDGCRLVGDVAIGIAPDASRPRTEEQLVMLMRNKAADMGATHVITEMSDSRTGSAGEPYFVGRGLAYDCPRDAVAPAQAQPSGGSSGGESGEGGEAAPVDDEAPPR